MKLASPDHDDVFFEQIDHRVRTMLATWFPSTAGSGTEAERGQVEVDYWSISYRLTSVQHSVFVKIPKMDMYQTEIASILKDPKARQSAQTEFDGFTRIHRIKDWPDGCSTVRPLAFIEEFNALLTEFTPSVDLFKQCRRLEPQILPKSEFSQRVQKSLRHCGEWLDRFQGSNEDKSEIQVDSQQLLEDILAWAAQIDTLCVCPNQLHALLRRLKQSTWSQELPRSRNCEGFEVRNIIVDQAGTVRLVDPGNVSWSSGLEDVAHFLVSLTMLYWGTPVLWMGIPLAETYRRSFLEGWAQNRSKVSLPILAWFETRELFRQWLDAYKVLERKPYPDFLRKFLRFAYVDAFFLNRIKHNVKLACQPVPRTDSTEKRPEA